jgi:L-threonylcarbamoyladenylate synthase
LATLESKGHTWAEVLPTDTSKLFAAAVNRAATELRAGQVVALPTETVYGLAANALDPVAVKRLFEIKGRPAHNPVIVHVVGVAMAKRCVTDWPPLAERLAKSFWPGPLTVVLPRDNSIPDIVTAGGGTVGVRWPSHPFMQAVIRECGFPLAAPSANPANRLSPTRAEHVHQHLGRRIRLIVDGGPCQVGIESTVVDVSCSPPRVLRPGMIHEQALAAVIGPLNLGEEDQPPILRSPGLLPRHYAPKAKLVLWSWSDEETLRARAASAVSSGVQRECSKSGTALPASASRSLERVFVVAHTRVPSGPGFGGVSVIPHDAEAFARAIYGELHRCDEAGAGLIVVEALPQSVEWHGIADRLRRAAAKAR